MRDLKPQDECLFGMHDASDDEALRRVRTALEFLYADETHSMHDKVAGVFDYEELTAALIAARDALQRHVDSSPA